VATRCDRLGAVASYFQQFEKEQEKRKKAKNLKAARRRKESAQTLPNRTFLLGLDIWCGCPSLKEEWPLKVLSTLHHPARAPIGIFTDNLYRLPVDVVYFHHGRDVAEYGHCACIQTRGTVAHNRGEPEAEAATARRAA
jgi:hypothetical protein